MQKMNHDQMIADRVKYIDIGGGWKKVRREVLHMVEPYKPLYTVKEAANVLKVNPSMVYELIKSRKLPYLLLGQKKVRGSDLERFIESYPAAKEGEKNDQSVG